MTVEVHLTVEEIKDLERVPKQDITKMKVYGLQSLSAHPHFPLPPFHGG